MSGKTQAAMIVCGVVSAAWVGCASQAPPAPAKPQLSAAQLQQATEMYSEQSCGICHGENGEGGEAGPALRELAPYWNEERLADYLVDPAAFEQANPDFGARRETEYEVEMPAYDYLAGEQLQVFTAWLMSL